MSSPGNSPVTNHASRVSDIGERALIERIRRRLPAPPRELLVGIGDDAAVTAPDRGSLQVLTTDALVEGVHFDRRFSTPSDIGYKALAVNISDVASMGGTSRFALLSLMLPAALTADELDGLLDGLLDLARETRLTLAGGNIRNVALAAAFLAADEDAPVRMDHVRRAAASEYVKLERTLTEGEVKGW